MNPRGFNLGSTCRQMPRHSPSFAPILPQDGGFHLSQQYVRNQVGFSTDWKEHPRIHHCRNFITSRIKTMFCLEGFHDESALQMVDIIEYWLFQYATSEEEYMNQETLGQRMQTVIQRLHEKDCNSTINPTSLHAMSNVCLAEPTFQNLASPNIVHEPVCIDNRDCLGTIQKSEPTIFLTTMGKSPLTESLNLFSNPHVSRETPEVPNPFPGMRSSCEHLSLREYHHQKLDFHQNSEHFMQPYELCSNASIPQTSSCFVDQDQQCYPMLGNKTLNEPQIPTTLLTGVDQFASASAAGHFCLDGSTVNSDSGLKASVEQRIMLEYFQYKNLNNVSGDSPIPFTNYLHLRVCSNGRCICDQSIKLSFHLKYCQSVQCQICSQWRLLCVSGIPESHLEHTNCMILDSVETDINAPSGISDVVPPPTKRLKVDPANIVSDPLTQKMGEPFFKPVGFPQLQQQPESPPSSIHSEVTSCSMEQYTNPNLDSVISEIKISTIDGTSGHTFKSNNISSEGLEGDHISKESKAKDRDVTACSNLKENVINETKNISTDDIVGQTFNRENIPSEGLEADHIPDGFKPNDAAVTTRSNINENLVTEIKNSVADDRDGHTLKKPIDHDVTARNNLKESVVEDIEEVQAGIEFNQGAKNSKKVIELKAHQQKEIRSSNSVSLTEFFTSDQIKQHIMSLRMQFGHGSTEEESRIAANTCQLCEMQKLFFSPVPIYCLCCGLRIKRNKYYYYRKTDEVVSQHCFCTACHNISRGGSITYNGISVSKELLDKKRNDEVLEESWVQCDKCKGWQHQVCALYNNKSDLDSSAEYICPRCRIKDIENGTHVPSPESAFFGAKDLPSTMLSDHLEKRLLKRLMQEREHWAKEKGITALDEVLAVEDLSVRVVLSVDKQLRVNKQFLDIFPEENYPVEFPYRLQVILLFQKIEGVDVCLFGMYVQEFGSDCGYPNQRSVYISYLDSVKYFRPERETVTGEALRTFVYHEILIGYLDYCKKRGFTTCYIWACPPLKGEDYVLYCHPDTQKTPKNDKLRRWYHSMLRKAAEENIVVGVTNVYEHFFVPSGKFDSKVTAARLPYFDGDFWSGNAMDLARKIEQESGGDYEKTLKEQVTKRTLKTMGYVNPSKGSAKDILVMIKLGQTMLSFKEDFILVHLQYECMHCHEVMVSGRRWFCTECKNFQECERCHTADSHTSVSGEKHTLCQVLMDDATLDTKENDTILDNELFENRPNFLIFCQKNQLQFDTLRRAKYSSMMILYHLRAPTLPSVAQTCSICSKHNVFQHSWKCDICPEFTTCTACYKESGANCHPHKLSRTSSTTLSRSRNLELMENSVMIQKLMKILQHASRCRSSKTQPCSYPNCLQIKMLFYHASKCTVRVAGGCQICKKAWLALTMHSRNCRDSSCHVPRCMDLKKHAEWIAMQFESRRRAAVVETIRGQ
ncbi:histone acetyltransferase HAC12-like [Arachis stenosperma]|uniref:histone acetyltransferase HAC12-like n=1 Tax=Arachis stenosperma TaxID=217475 RepID=UPI0025AC69D8|nr:histone acetyltransferase HAC12-like [Arachis stenosperma]XP_057741179.1 histone acetyltransferase HAC12-like [Arachis stenosperma]